MCICTYLTHPHIPPVLHTFPYPSHSYKHHPIHTPKDKPFEARTEAQPSRPIVYVHTYICTYIPRGIHPCLRRPRAGLSDAVVSGDGCFRLGRTSRAGCGVCTYFSHLALGLGVHACGDRGGAWLACARAHTVVTQRRQWRSCHNVWGGYALIRKAVGNKAADSGITGFGMVRQR
jgi:hypothetical protein